MDKRPRTAGELLSFTMADGETEKDEEIDQSKQLRRLDKSEPHRNMKSGTLPDIAGCLDLMYALPRNQSSSKVLDSYVSKSFSFNFEKLHKALFRARLSSVLMLETLTYSA